MACLSAMAFRCPPEALPPPLSMGQLGPGCVGCCCMLRERESVRKKIKRLCVGEAKKNITAWQHCCREWRTWRRSVGEKGKGTPGWVRGRVWQRGRWEWCVCVCVHWGNIYGRVVRSYCFLPVFSRSGWGSVVGPAGRDRGQGRRWWQERGRQAVGGGGLSQHWVNTGRLGWVGGWVGVEGEGFWGMGRVAHGSRCRQRQRYAPEVVGLVHTSPLVLHSHSPTCWINRPYF